jgi:hypothetical protein
MLFLLVPTLFGILLLLAYGWLMEFIAVRAFNIDYDHDNHFSVTIFLGMALLSGLLGIWSFYWGISTRADIFFSALALLGVVGIRRYATLRLQIIYAQIKSMGALSWLVWLLLLVYALYLASAQNPSYDTGLYHAQSIRWTENFHVVAGLANLNLGFGVNSNLFLLAALWGFVGLGLHLYQVPDLVIYVVSALYFLSLIENSRKFLTISGMLAFGNLVFLLIEQRFVPSWLASPTTDLPAAIICWTVLLLTIQKIEAGRLAKFDLQTFGIIFLSFLGISIKLSTAPILLISLYLLWKAHAAFSLKTGSLLGFLIAAIFLPWIARNVILTGFFLFPLYQLDLFRFDWKVPVETVKPYALYITSWARIPGGDPQVVLPMKLNVWFPIWFRSLLSIDVVVLYGLVIGALTLTLYAVIKKQALDRIRTYGIVYAVCMVGAAFWFVQAPDPRFGYGFLIALLGLFFAPVLVGLTGSIERLSRGFIYLAQLILVFYVFTSLLQVPVTSWMHRLKAHPAYPVVSTNSFLVDGQTLYMPVSGDQCWYDPFPCAPYLARGLAQGLHLRGAKFEDGFHIISAK